MLILVNRLHVDRIANVVKITGKPFVRVYQNLVEPHQVVDRNVLLALNVH